MAIPFSDLTITSLETIDAFDVQTGEYLWTLDELQNATIANTEENVDITGKQGRLLNTIKRNKAVTISGSNGLISGGLLETQTGGTWEDGEVELTMIECLPIRDNKAVTTHVATGTVGQELGTIIIRNAGGGVGNRITQVADASALSPHTFLYDPATKTITFDAGTYGDDLEVEITISYNYKVRGNRLKNKSDIFSKKARLSINAFGEDKCNNVYRMQFHVDRADCNGNFDFTMGDAQSVHAFEFRSLAGANCRCASDGSAVLWDVVVVDEDAEDIVEGTVDGGSGGGDGGMEGF